MNAEKEKKTNKLREFFRGRNFRAGGYSLASVAIVIAIAILVNVLFSALPDSLTKIDITPNSMFSLSSQSTGIVDALEDEVTIYWIVQSGQEDSYLETLLGRYTERSDNLKLVKKDPDVNPTFAQEYTQDKIYNNSLILVSGSRSKYVSSSELYEYDYSDYYTTGSYDVSFAGENAITSAIDYVTRESVPVIYTLSGHGEEEMPSSLSSSIESENFQLEELKLISANAVPDDADCVMLLNPRSDISSEELELLLDYTDNGGKIILITEPLETGKTRPNIDALAAGFGMEETQGIVIEGDGNYYAYGMPYYLLPELESHDITQPLIDGGYYVLLPIAHGVSSTGAEGAEVAPLLDTTSQSYSKISGYDLSSYEKEEGDIEGPFSLASVSAKGDGALIWISSSAILDETCNMQVSGGNSDFLLNCVSYLCGEDESKLSIRAKSLSYEYLTMSSSVSSAISSVIVVILPLAALLTGIAIRYRRKRR